MDCKEFKDKVADLFDKMVDAQTQHEIEAHAAMCAECCDYYKGLKDVFEALKPKATINFAPQSIAKRHTMRKGLLQGVNRHVVWRWVAAIAIFVAGMMVGWSNFFSNSAEAKDIMLREGLLGVQNVGSCQMTVYIRTLPNENFDYMDPNADFVKTDMQMLRQNDTLFYRVAKENGRTVVCDGVSQYLWTPNGLFAKGGLRANFLEQLGCLLFPERILAMQKSAIKIAKTNVVVSEQNDSTVILTVIGLEKSQDMQELLKKGEMSEYETTIQNIFSRSDGLLRSVKMWVEHKGHKHLMLYIENIRYNVPIERSAVVELPQVAAEKWINADNPRTYMTKSSSVIKNETPEQAINRILNALTTANYAEASDALQNYREFTNSLRQKFYGCKVSGIIKRQDDSYVGIYFFFTLTRPDGSSSKQHISIRNDNKEGIWIVDGGI